MKKIESDSDDFGPVIPDNFEQELEEKEEMAEEEAQRKKEILTVAYRRPKRFKQNADENMHPLDEKRLLSQAKLEHTIKREKEINNNMKSLMNKMKQK